MRASGARLNGGWPRRAAYEIADVQCPSEILTLGRWMHNSHWRNILPLQRWGRYNALLPEIVTASKNRSFFGRWAEDRWLCGDVYLYEILCFNVMFSWQYELVNHTESRNPLFYWIMFCYYLSRVRDEVLHDFNSSSPSEVFVLLSMCQWTPWEFHPMRNPHVEWCSRILQSSVCFRDTFDKAYHLCCSLWSSTCQICERCSMTEESDVVEEWKCLHSSPRAKIKIKAKCIESLQKEKREPVKNLSIFKMID